MSTASRFRRLIAAGVALIVAACSSPPESPWAADRDVNSLPVATDDDAESDRPERDDPATEAVGVTDHDCHLDEVRCGVVTVPQVADSPDLVSLGFRILADAGDGTPVVQLDDGSGTDLLDADDFPDRPLVVIGNRGQYPGRPNLACPEFFEARSNDDFRAVLVACLERFDRTGIDPAGTLPTRLGADVGLALNALGFDEVDLVVPTWRALSTPGIAEHVSIRRVVYLDPWLGTDRSVGAAASVEASIEAVWDRCGSTPGCDTAGTVADFMEAILELDDRPLDDVEDVFSDEPRPLDTARVADAVVANGTRAADLAFLPRLHRAILERDAELVSAYVRTSISTSTDVNLLGVTCSLFDEATADPSVLRAPLRAHAEDGIEIFSEACARWPSETPTAPPLPGLSVLTDSTPTDGADYRLATEAGPVIVEPTVGLPTERCVIGAAAAWFARAEVDDSDCRTELVIGARDQVISLTPGVYETPSTTVGLPVPDTWTDSGAGTWWREADPLDRTNLDVYVWEAADAETARSQIVDEWYLEDPVLSALQVDDRIWLRAAGSYGDGSTYDVAVARIDGHNIALILQTESDETPLLVDDVLLPAMREVTVS